MTELEKITTKRLALYTGRTHPDLAEEVASHLGIKLGQANIVEFANGEIKPRFAESVRGSDVFIIQSHYGVEDRSVNDSIMEQLIMIDAAYRASAKRITAVCPYYGYARQDRKDVGRVPITAKLVADLLQSAGANRVLALDLHAAQLQGFFDIPVDHMHASPVINDYVRSLNIPPRDFVVLSPDEGSIKKSLLYQKKLGGAIAIVDKRRASAVDTSQANLIGSSLEGKVAVIFDDMISTAGSVVGAVRVAKQHGARKVYVCATHPVLCGPAIERLQSVPIEEIVLTDSIPIPPEKMLRNMRVLSVAPLLADAIQRIHHNQSVSKLFE